MAHPHRLGESVFRQPPRPVQQPASIAPSFGRGFSAGRDIDTPPEGSTFRVERAGPRLITLSDNPTPEEEAVGVIARDLEQIRNEVREQVKEAQTSGRDIQRLFGPQSEFSKFVEREIGTFGELLEAANMDTSIAARAFDLIRAEFPAPQTQITKTAPGEDIQLITAGPGGARTAERIGGTAPLPTVVPQGGTLAETRTGQVLTRGQPTPRKADTQVVAARDKDGNIVNVVVSKADGKVVGEFGRGPDVSFVDPNAPRISSTELAALDDSEIGARTAIRGAFELRNAVLEGGPSVLGAPGVLSGLAQGFVSQTLGFAQLIGVDTSIFESGASADDAGAKADTIFARIDKAGTINAEIRSAIVNVAFAAAAASGQIGKGVSDKDFDRFVRELGAGASKPAVFASVLTKFAQRQSNNFSTRFTVKSRRIRGMENVKPPDLFKEIFGASGASAATPGGVTGGGARAASLAEGTTATNPQGQKLVVRGGKWVSQ